jgi:thiamine pyrophosphate-dependent acetolactate synthase large subunit-like protein
MAEKVDASLISGKVTLPRTSRIAADSESVEAAAELLVKADKPVIYATFMGRRLSAVYWLVELAEALGCGVLDGRTFLNFPMDHPLLQGFYSWRERNPLIEEADVILSVENYYEPPFTPPEGSTIIVVNSDPLVIQGGGGGDYGGSLYPASLRLVGDPATIISQLSSSVRRRMESDGAMRKAAEDRFEINRARHEETFADWSKEAERHLEEDPVSPHRIAYELNRLWDSDTVWLDATITVRKALMQGIFLNQPGTYFTNPSWHLGPIAGAAYGMALAKPDKKVVAMMGDGDFVMGNPPAVLWTCSHYHIPVLYIVFNNACWGIEWPYIVDTTLRLSVEAKNYECVDIDKPRLSFKRMAESAGVEAEVIEHPDEAKETLERGFQAVSRGEPRLIEVQLPKYTEGESSYRYIFRRAAVPIKPLVP